MRTHVLRGWRVLSTSSVFCVIFGMACFCLQELDNFCNPIVYKPKPKVEVPEDKAKANSEHNGPMDGQSGTETNPDPAKGSSQHTESGEMDVD